MQGNLQLEPWILVSQEHSSHHSGHSSYAIRREQLKVDQAALGRQQWSFPVPSEMRQYGVRIEMVKIWFCFLHRPSHWPLVCPQFFVGERALLGRLQLSYGKLLIQKKEELGNGLSAFSQRSNSLGPAERGADGTGREGDPRIHPDPPPPPPPHHVLKHEAPPRRPAAVPCRGCWWHTPSPPARPPPRWSCCWEPCCPRPRGRSASPSGSP